MYVYTMKKMSNDHEIILYIISWPLDIFYDIVLSFLVSAF